MNFVMDWQVNLRLKELAAARCSNIFTVSLSDEFWRRYLVDLRRLVTADHTVSVTEIVELYRI